MKRCLVFCILLALLLVPAAVLAERALAEGETDDLAAYAEKKLEVEDLSFELGVMLNIRIKAQNCQMAGYYFGSVPKQPKANNHDWMAYSSTYLRTTKFPGNYYLWLRDTEGNMYGPTYVEMPQVYNTYFRMDNTKFPGEAISTYLPTYCDYTVEELDALIAENVSKAGIYTREAVVVGITVQFSKLQEFGIRIPFFFYGYWPVREYGWYLNPDWGTTYNLNTQEGYAIWRGEKPAEHEAGTHCNGFVHYAFRLAGLNVRNTGSMGETGDIGGVGGLHRNKVGTYEGRPGDVLQGVTKPNHHEMIIIDRYDDNLDGESDGYIVAESNDDEGGQVYCKKPFDTYAKFCKVFNMDGVYYNTATQQRMLKFWSNYHIPIVDWPEYLQTAVRENTRYTVVFEDALGIREVEVPFRGMLEGMPEIRGMFEGHADGATWSEDITGQALERNYIIRANYTVAVPEGFVFVPTPEPTATPTPAPTPEPTPTPTPSPTPTPPLPVVEILTTKAPALTEAPLPTKTPQITEAPQPEAPGGIRPVLILCAAAALAAGLITALILVRRRQK